MQTDHLNFQQGSELVHADSAPHVRDVFRTSMDNAFRRRSPQTGEAAADTRVNLDAVELACLRDILVGARCYLEYGAGEATHVALGLQTLTEIHSVDSSAPPLQSIVLTDPRAAEAQRTGRLRSHVVEFASATAAGAHMARAGSVLGRNYVLAPYLGPGPFPQVDVVLVDGHFRIACVLAAFLYVPHATVALHDFAMRPEYRPVLKFADVVTQAGSLIVLRRAASADPRAMQNMLSQACRLPVDGLPLQARAQRWVRRLRLGGIARSVAFRYARRDALKPVALVARDEHALD